MGRMSKEDLFREIGEIDEAYVEEAQRAGRRRRASSRVGKTLVAAASLVFCVGVGYMTVLFTQPRGSSGGSMNAASGADGTAMEAAKDQYSMAEDIAGQTAGGGAAGEAEEEKVSQAGALETGAGQASQEAASAAEPGRTPQETVSAATPAPHYDGRDASSPESESEEGVPGQIRELQEEISAMTEQEGSMEDWLYQSGGSAMDLTWEAARTDAVYGRYVDVQAPEGYSFTSAVRTSSALHVTWNKGMGEISIICRQADEDVSDLLVDVERPEEYDLGLYTIPWCDSVPQELIQKVDNAVFRPDQVTPEILAARTFQAQESGDVSGSRTQIGILYSDNVLVVIRSKGPSAEEIYTMINLEN